MAVFKAAITSYVKRQNMSNKKPLKILIEASGCLTSSYMIEAIKNAGHIVCGSDIDSFNTAFIECDDFIIMPKVSDAHLWDKTLHLCRAHHIDIVIPTLDESLLGWSEQKAHFAQYGILVIISAPHTIQTFLDKWQTYQFFCQIGIPTPKSSLYKHYGVLKPRFGRGGSGIELAQIDRFFNGGGIMMKILSHLSHKSISLVKNTLSIASLMHKVKPYTSFLVAVLVCKEVNPLKARCVMSSA